MILGGLSLLPTGSDADAIPDEKGARPAGATNEAVLAAVQASLALCAQTQVLQQANCPQKVDEPTGQANEVHWALHGNPAAITRQSFDPTTGLTHLTGSYAATATAHSQPTTTQH